MQIKQQALSQQLKKKLAPLYVLIGQDHYLINEALTTIKSTIKQQHDSDERVFSLQTPEDWATLIEEANSYSLFSDTVLLNLFCDKKSIEAVGKKVMTEYLKTVNTRCFIIIRAPNIPAKQLQWLNTHEQAVVVVSYPLNKEAMKHWIAAELKKNSLLFDHQIPDLIFQYTQGNMLACAQAIEKIALSNEINSQISSKQALDHLSYQCEHSLFELIEACLIGQANNAIQILREAANNKTEATLVLWMMAQEIRILNQLHYLLQQGVGFSSACSQLKIWPQRSGLYQKSVKRLNINVLKHLTHYCHMIDGQIKSNLSSQVWSSLENLALSVCLGTSIGGQCTL